MNFIFSFLVTTRILTIFTGSGVTDSLTPGINDPSIILTGDQVQISCAVRNPYPPELRKLAETGTPVVLYLFTELRQRKGKALIYKTTQERILWYDLIKNEYCVKKGTQPDTLRFSSGDSAISAASSFTAVNAFPRRVIRPGSRYYIQIYSILGKTKVEALANRDIDLMYYWDYKRPFIKTEMMPASLFLVKDGGK